MSSPPPTTINWGPEEEGESPPRGAALGLRRFVPVHPGPFAIRDRKPSIDIRKITASSTILRILGARRSRGRRQRRAIPSGTMTTLAAVPEPSSEFVDPDDHGYVEGGKVPVNLNYRAQRRQ